uniref:NADH dehydrogenase subunit 6 n=1 Tax=Macrostemum radiatum TaxID=1875683 RepID=UPI00223786C4|nr:NADH dehydrogenase subunit 6 [Macrostemum radiatum]UYO79406.1 NADH dehydrogenase subunit 6 [Macrostemum radiatum]
MFLLILFFIIILFNLMFLMTKTPLTTALILFIQTINITLMMNLNLNIYWISYIFYLMMIGGLLILFMYMCSISSNEIILINLINLIFLMSVTFLVLVLLNNYYFLFSLKTWYFNFYWNSSSLFNIISDPTMINNKLFSSNFHFMTIMLMNYLLLSLMVISNLISHYNAPLRSSM